ncbi:type II toxin-antitoxin system RelB/DinJ family antitoxin [Patescibacteria group bacterium]|nr:type II toxin-antitoxin system RelB/DinJ family antitoxin [Patescibacteria group bacterium]
MPTLQIRIDEKTKRDGKKVLDALGLDMSSAVKIFLKRLIAQQGIPFPVVTTNGLTINQELEILTDAEEARRGVNVSKAMNAKEAITYLEHLT